MNKAYKPAGHPHGAVAIIPAAGAGVRMGGKRAKQFLELEGKPLLAVTLERFQAASSVESIILVVPAEEIDFCRQEIVAGFNLDKIEKVVAGGARRLAGSRGRGVVRHERGFPGNGVRTWFETWESAGMNRHRGGGGRAPRRRASDPR